jgi:hypothetical protein
MIESSSTGGEMQLAAGTVVSLWRYPVKSMQGEELNGAVVTWRGIVGGRAYALIDRETGLVASASTRGNGVWFAGATRSCPADPIPSPELVI